MSQGGAKERLNELRRRISDIRAEMRAVATEVAPERVGDHVFQSGRGEVRLSELFGDKRELIIIHSMGAGCAYCTLWADGYNGLYPHIADRAAFVIASPDTPDAQARFAQTRGWCFPMVSDTRAAFAMKMGYATADGACRPGMSVFQKQADGLVRVADVNSCPHDDFCAVWHLFDLLPGGAGAWGPRLDYTA